MPLLLASGVVLATVARAPAQTSPAPSPAADGSVPQRSGKDGEESGGLRLSNDAFVLGMDPSTGTLTGLHRKDDPVGANFLGNERNRRVERRGCGRSWTGDAFVLSRRKPSDSWYCGHTSRSADVRTVARDRRSLVVTYAGASKRADGIRDLTLRQRWTLRGEALIWRLELVNTSSEKLQVGAVGLPIVFNGNPTLGVLEQGWGRRSSDEPTLSRSRRVWGDALGASGSSYLCALRPAGHPPHLLVRPIEGTRFEATVGSSLRDRVALEIPHVEPNGSVVYLDSEADREAHGGKPPFGVRGGFSLAPGGRKRFALELRWIDTALLRLRAYELATIRLDTAHIYTPLGHARDNAVIALAPLFVQELDAALPGIDTVPGPDHPATDAARQPDVHLWESTVRLAGHEHRQLTFSWSYPPRPPRGADSRTRRTDSPEPERRAVRWTLDSAGWVAAAEVLSTPPLGVRTLFVSASLEKAAREAHGAPLAGRRHAVETSVDDAPNVVVAGTYEDGVVPMGPFLYMTRTERRIALLLCRCSPSRVSSLPLSLKYALVTTDEPPALVLESGDRGLDEILRLPAEF